MNNANEFINTFASIEKLLAKEVKQSEYVKFYELIEMAKKKNAIVRHNECDLKQFADLRNAIVHNRPGGHPIAKSYVETVRSIKKIYIQLKEPPLIKNLAKKVETISPKTKLSEVLKIIYNKKYSQIPVYDNSSDYVGIITTNAITRWMISESYQGLVSFEETEVSKVLEYKEETEKVAFVSEKENLFRVLELFKEYLEKGKKLEAVIISHSGSKKEKPICIVTVWDIPNILNEIEYKE
ncbi:MAG: CBS domain-containing protein [Kosmotoga sp.]|nr:MAG: CBS domain-containing protein [Kosmotoga sp.]